MEITYHGWSGVSLNRGPVHFGFDLMSAPSRSYGRDGSVLCFTHGHPDHVGAIQSMSKQSDPEVDARTHVVSSRDVLRAFASERNGPRHLHAMQPGDHIELASAEIECFDWNHMSLLPPGLWPKLSYVRSLLSHPIGLARIGVEGLGHPLRAPMLGFGVRFDDGLTVVNYGEGLHRHTDIAEVERVAERFAPQVVLFAVEPEDTEAIPRFLEILDPDVALIYEAHRPWRELFELPWVDLDDYAAYLTDRLPATDIIPLVEPDTSVEVELP